MTEGNGQTPPGIEFPCRWPVKAMVAAGDAARARVQAVIARHADFSSRDDVRVRPSRHGRFESITVTIEARSREHLEGIYGALRALDEVKMTL